jgi:hypothetical protein
VTPFQLEILADLNTVATYYGRRPRIEDWRDWYGEDPLEALNGLVAVGHFVRTTGGDHGRGTYVSYAPKEFTPKVIHRQDRLADRIYTALVPCAKDGEVTAGTIKLGRQLDTESYSIEDAIGVLQKDGRLVRTDKRGFRGAIVYRITA